MIKTIYFENCLSLTIMEHINESYNTLVITQYNDILLFLLFYNTPAMMVYKNNRNTYYMTYVMYVIHIHKDYGVLLLPLPRDSPLVVDFISLT